MHETHTWLLCNCHMGPYSTLENSNNHKQWQKKSIVGYLLLLAKPTAVSYCDRGGLNTQIPRYILGWWLESRLVLGSILHFCSIYPYTVSLLNGKLWPFVTFHNPSLGFTKMIPSAPVLRSVCYSNSLALTSVFCKGPLLQFNPDIFHCTQCVEGRQHLCRCMLHFRMPKSCFACNIILIFILR